MVAGDDRRKESVRVTDTVCVVDHDEEVGVDVELFGCQRLASVDAHDGTITITIAITITITITAGGG